VRRGPSTAAGSVSGCPLLLLLPLLQGQEEEQEEQEEPLAPAPAGQGADARLSVHRSLIYLGDLARWGLNCGGWARGGGCWGGGRGLCWVGHWVGVVWGCV
jgi:hypothetical protein